MYTVLQGAASERKTRYVMYVMTKMTKKVHPRGSSFAANVSLYDEEKNEDVKNKATTLCNNSAFSGPCLYKPHREKLEILRRNCICFGCLMKGHLSKDCKKRPAKYVLRNIQAFCTSIKRNIFTNKQTQDVKQKILDVIKRSQVHW